ncbi:helix-turn-helix transcriptional regulator [Natronomonas sp.]|uniref:helix-turn-helix transcriptional regulator n=1 Tax=Natronomonas sp. TaxID=2184060 RepID=UPI003976F035
MRCRVPILLCALLLVLAPFGAVPASGQPQTDGTHFDVRLHADGDATWNVSLRVPIENDDEREEFEAFAERFEAGEENLDLGTDSFRQAAAEASSASGREMSIESVRRDSRVVTGSDGSVTDAGTDGPATATDADDPAARHGVLRITFTWQSFARPGENNTLYVDDAFNTTDGTWLPALSADQSLTIRSPPGYGGPTTSPVGAEGGDLHWSGPTTFEPGYFTIVYHPSSTAAPAGGVSTTLVVGALALSGSALLLGVYLLMARRRSGATSNGESPRTAASTVSDAAGAQAGPPDSEPVGDSPADTPASTTERASDNSEDGADTGDEPDFDLLSDEERVEYLLEQNGGRMKQAMIVKETGWSNAKVSQLLSSMDEADQVDKLRIGRENLISLPGEGIGDLANGDDER